MSTPLSLIFDEPAFIALFPGDGPPRSVQAVTPKSHTYMQNKDLSHPSNAITVTDVIIGGTTATLPTTANLHEVLAYDGTDLVFVPLTQAPPPVDNTPYGPDTLSAITVGTGNSGFGNATLQNVTTANDNTAVGHHALRVNVGFNNTAVGHDSASTNASGAAQDNTSCGSLSMQLLIGGSRCTAIGYAAAGAGIAAPFANDITAVGAYSLSHISPFMVGFSALGTYAAAYQGASAFVENGVAFGYGAMRGNPATIASNNPAGNTAGGAHALSNTASAFTATYNTAFGYGSMREIPSAITEWTAFGCETAANITASPGTVFGFRAGTSLTSATNCTLFGNHTATVATTATATTAIGDKAAPMLTSGIRNTFVGATSGANVITGASNTVVGYLASVDAISRSNSIVIGAYASTTNIDAHPVTNGTLALGSIVYPLTTSSAAGAGTIGPDPLPVTPEQYLNVTINGTKLYIPVYL